MVLQWRVPPITLCTTLALSQVTRLQMSFSLFVFYCFHVRLKEELRAEGLLETIEASGTTILPEDAEGRHTEVGVPT